MYKKFAPWLNNEFFTCSKLRDELHTIAIKSNAQNDWRNFRRQRNLCNKLNKKCKAEFYAKKLNKIDLDTNANNGDDSGNDGQCNDEVLNDNHYSDKKMWRCVRELTNSNKQQPPRLLKINGVFTTSLRKITNECNNYFVNKIAKLRG